MRGEAHWVRKRNIHGLATVLCIIMVIATGYLNWNMTETLAVPWFLIVMGLGNFYFWFDAMRTLEGMLKDGYKKGER